MVETIVTGSFFTNTYIISKGNECVIVDPGLDFEQTALELQKKYKVLAILLTHGHMDHIDGIRYFKAPVYIHGQEEEFLYDASLSLYRMVSHSSPYHRGDLEVIRVSDGTEFELMGETFKVLHTPGHTRGSVCYSFKNKVFSGDTLFHLSAGRTDFPTGNSKELRESLQRMIKLFSDSTDVYPGHDEKTTIHMERKYNPFLQKFHATLKCVFFLISYAKLEL